MPHDNSVKALPSLAMDTISQSLYIMKQFVWMLQEHQVQKLFYITMERNHF